MKNTNFIFFGNLSDVLKQNPLLTSNVEKFVWTSRSLFRLSTHTVVGRRWRCGWARRSARRRRWWRACASWCWARACCAARWRRPPRRRPRRTPRRTSRSSCAPARRTSSPPSTTPSSWNTTTCNSK